MAESMTAKVEGNPFLDDTDDFRVICDWISGATGVVSQSIATAVQVAFLASHGYAQPQASKIRSELVKVETIPGLNGNLTDNLPTALYDLTLLDAYGADVVDGALADRSGTAADIPLIPGTPIKVDSNLTVTIAAAGAGTKGRIILHFRGKRFRG